MISPLSFLFLSFQAFCAGLSADVWLTKRKKGREDNRRTPCADEYAVQK